MKRILGNISLAFFFLLFTPVMHAQSQKQFIQVGDKLTNKGDHYGASVYYRKAMNLDSSDLSLVFKYAESLRNYNNYDKAAKYYEQVYSKDKGRTYLMAPYWMATMQKMNGNYRDAERSFRRASRLFRRDRKSFYYKKIEQEEESCDFAKELMEDTVDVDVKNAKGINTFDSEFGARFLNDTALFFSSLRAKELTDKNVVEDETYHIRIYQASRKNKDKEDWQTTGELPDIINSSGFHVANGSFSPDGERFYFTRCDTNYNCNIFVSKFNGRNWSHPEKLHDKINWKDYSNTQPFECKIGEKKVLLFASDRPYGSGKFDIWYSEIDEYGNYGNPINMGPTVNSIDDEITPFYHVGEKALYFSSDWYFGLGGFDIFKSHGTIENFDEPENLGFPVNSPVNDYYYTIRGNTAFLTSNRKGSMAKKDETCCNDLYYYEVEVDSVRDTSIVTKLEKYLPLSLYFHNDIPDPRSRDTTTAKNYLETYNEYTSMIDKYVKEYSKGLEGDEKLDAKEDIIDFFDDYVNEGATDLKDFTPLLLKVLKDGRDVDLTIKGYASPLAKSDYNVNLTLRRISSLKNYLKEYRGGVFQPYLTSSDTDTLANLNFIHVPYGEYQSKKLVSDNINDLKNSVYSRAAALERKIEIIAIAVKDTGNVMLDGTKMKTQARVEFTEVPEDFHTLVLRQGKADTLRHVFTNTGGEALEIFSAGMECKCFEVVYPKQKILPGEKGEVKVIIDAEAPEGEYAFLVKVLTNGVPSIKEFKYEFKLVRKQ